MNKISAYTTVPVIIFLLLFTQVVLPGAAENPLAGIATKGKEPMYGLGSDTGFPVLAAHPENAQCLEECISRNQMAAVGFEVLEEQCRRQCALGSILVQVKSASKGEYEEGVKALCDIQDPRTVLPLITALERDLKERTGLWAWIIPALGTARDQRAVPVLTKTLVMMDEDWLGREMSARALGEIGDPVSIPALLAAAWRADTRDAAIGALARHHDKRIVPVLLSALVSDEEPETRQLAITGLHNLGSVAVPEMLAAFTDFSPEFPQTQKRLELCRLLAASGDKRAWSMLQQSANDPDKKIRECVKKYGP